jgi:hypothetical protein
MGCHDLLRAVIEGLTSPAIERMGSTPAGWNAVAETESSPKLNSRPDIVTLMTASAFAGVEMDASAGGMFTSPGQPRAADRFWIVDAGQVLRDAAVPGQGRVPIERLGRNDVLGLSWLAPPCQ